MNPRPPQARWLAALAALALLGAAPPARAQGIDEFGPYEGPRARQKGSDQGFAAELRIARYLPRVDDEFGGSGPFAATFGDANRYLLGLEVDWQALRIPHFGSLGPGVGLGYTSASADALLADGSGRSAQSTSLTILPLHAVAVLRVDVLARETAVPLAAYGKLGLGYAFWSVGSGDGTARVGDVEGEGASYGLQWAVGGMFLLDSLDQDAALGMDASTGANHAYLFFEWFDSNLDNFGGAAMNVGASSWALGITLEI